MPATRVLESPHNPTDRPTQQPARKPQSWIPPLVLTALIGASIFLFSPNYRRAPGQRSAPLAGDYLQEWVGGFIVQTGHSHQLYDQRLARRLQHDPNLLGFTWDQNQYYPMVYPPFYYALVSPLSRISYPTAGRIWLLLMIGFFALSMAMLVRIPVSHRCDHHFRDRWRRFALWTLPLAVLFMPVVRNFSMGQKGAVCLFLIIATFVLLHNNRPRIAGLVFGLLAFKPQFTIVIVGVMLWKRQWRFLSGAAVTGFFLAAASIALGADVCWEYVEFVTGAAEYIKSGGYDLTESHCIYGFLTLLFGGEPNAWVKGATVITIGGVLLALGRILQGPLRTDSPRFLAQFSGMVLATLLVSPHLYTYDLTILLAPMFLLGFWAWPFRPQATRPLAAPGARPHLPSQRSAAWIVGLLAAIYAICGASASIAQLTSIQITTILMLAVLGLLSLPTIDSSKGRSQFLLAQSYE